MHVFLQFDGFYNPHMWFWWFLERKSKFYNSDWGIQQSQITSNSKNSWTFVYNLTRQCRSSFNWTNYFEKETKVRFSRIWDHKNFKLVLEINSHVLKVWKLFLRRRRRRRRRRQRPLFNSFIKSMKYLSIVLHELHGVLVLSLVLNQLHDVLLLSNVSNFETSLLLKCLKKPLKVSECLLWFSRSCTRNLFWVSFYRHL